MIHKLLLIFALFISYFVSAQTNPGFETWTTAGSYEDPNGWFTFNNQTVFLGGGPCVGRSNDAHSGAYSCQMTSKTVTSQGNSFVMPGFITLSANGTVQGIPYTLRPDSIVFWYKYIPAGTDLGLVSLMLQKDGQEVANAQAYLSAQPTWKRGGIKLVYENGNTPDTLILNFASNALSGTEGSVFKVDDVQIIPGGATTSLENQHIAQQEIQIYPNPAKNELTVRLEKEAAIEIYNVLGAKIQTLRPNGTDKTIIPVSEFSNGVYILKTSTGLSERFVVKH